MGTATSEATTNEQVAVLEEARDNPSLEPKEIAERLGDDFGTGYVTKILDNFHLPGDNDNPKSESAKRLDKVVVDGVVQVEVSELPECEDRWSCALCDYTRDRSISIRRHIDANDDGAHDGRDGYEENHLTIAVGDNSEAINRLNKHCVNKPYGNDALKILYAVTKHPDVTQGEISDATDVSVSRLGKIFANYELDWSNRRDDVQNLLNKCEIEFVKPKKEPEKVERQKGNASYSGPPMDATEQAIADRPIKQTVEEREKLKEDTQNRVGERELDEDDDIELSLSVSKLTHIIQRSSEEVAEDIVRQITK